MIELIEIDSVLIKKKGRELVDSVKVDNEIQEEIMCIR